MKVYGPYTRKDLRKHVIIIDDDGNRRTKSYPKFLLEQKLGRELAGDDFTNDDLDNLKVLSRSENSKKGVRFEMGVQLYTFRCPMCDIVSHKPLKHVVSNHNKGRRGPFCSRKCAGRAGRIDP